MAQGAVVGQYEDLQLLGVEFEGGFLKPCYASIVCFIVFMVGELFAGMVVDWKVCVVQSNVMPGSFPQSTDQTPPWGDMSMAASTNGKADVW